MAKSFRIPQETVDRYQADESFRHECMLGQFYAILRDIEDVFQAHQMMGTMGFLLMEMHGAKFLTDKEYAFEKGVLDEFMTEARKVLGQNIK